MKPFDLTGRLVLAPMAGFTDSPFRRIARRHGAALVYTELVSAEGIARGNRNTHELMRFLPEHRPVAIQRPGKEAGLMAQAGHSAPADSFAAAGPRRYRIAPMDSTRLRFHRGRFDAPRWVMMRSLLVPGWGQLHNGSWLKALLLGGGEVALIVGIVRDNDSLDGLRAAAERARVEADEATYNAAVQPYNDRLDRLTSREWLLGGVLVYALADAFVDAHFRDFELEFEIDPALPGGTPGAGGARLAVGWAF